MLPLARRLARHQARLDPTPIEDYQTRREWLRDAGFTGVGLAAALSGLGCERPASSASAESTPAAEPSTQPVDVPPTRVADDQVAPPLADLYPAARNPKYTVNRELTPETIATTYNNFYEFDSTSKESPAAMVHKFIVRPWEVEIGGLVHKPLTIDADDLARRMGLEERLYRFRCVEAWAMTVPWIGFPLANLIKLVEPLSSARFVRFVSFLRPDQAPEQKNNYFPWPYYEALRMDEALNELTLIVTGMYGKPLPKQNGAPIRVITPWKYGYKSPKSIVKIEFVEQQPPTFWNDLAPREYSFLSNVEPSVPHPRWSQATERIVGTNERVRTLPYNGYAEFVADLYAS